MLKHGNPKRFISKNAWLNDARQTAAIMFHAGNTPVIDGKAYPPLWWIHQEIRIFCEEGIHKSTARHVSQAIRRRVRELELHPFDIKVIGVHENSTTNINLARDGECINRKKLFEILLSEIWRDPRHGGRQHADVLLLNRYFFGDSKLWGESSFKHGVMLLALPGERQDADDYLKEIVMVETCRLLGYTYDCGDFSNVAKYPYEKDCDMHFERNPSGRICQKCRDWISEFWQALRKT
jgi:hypothetical protein